MKRLALAAALSFAFAGGAFAQSTEPSATPAMESVAPSAAPSVAPQWTGPEVTLNTTLGDIVLTLDTVGAPKTAAQFLKLVRAGHYNGARFYRIEPNFLIQIGDEDATGAYRKPPFPAIPLETATNHHEKYAVGMAHGDNPNSGQATWYIDLADNAFLSAKEGAPPNTTGFAVFAHVTAGFDVADKIGAVERLPKGGPFPGKLPKTPVLVKKATVTKAK